MMRVGIDASNLRAGGGITHLVELLRAATPGDCGFAEVVVWGGRSTLSKIEDRDWLRKIQEPLLDRSLPFRLFWQRFRLKNLAVQAGCDVLFVPGGSDASGFKPMVTMSRNLLPFEWREMRRYGLSWSFVRNALLHYAQTQTFRKADGLIFLTRFARDVVMKVVGRSGGEVSMIPHGIDRRFFRMPRTQRAIAEYTLENPFRVLYVSSVDLYKHQWHVAEAVARLRSAGFPVVLEFVGPSFAPAMARLKETLDRVDPKRDFIRCRGAVPHDDLHQLYSSADIGVFASSCENMPNILLEGMASGLPIACSDRGPMPEILGDAGVFFNPEQAAEIAEAIRGLIESPALRAGKAAAAHERAKRFDWQRCASETFSFIGRVASGKSPICAS